MSSYKEDTGDILVRTQPRSQRNDWLLRRFRRYCLSVQRQGNHWLASMQERQSWRHPQSQRNDWLLRRFRRYCLSVQRPGKHWLASTSKRGANRNMRFLSSGIPVGKFLGKSFRRMMFEIITEQENGGLVTTSAVISWYLRKLHSQPFFW